MIDNDVGVPTNPPRLPRVLWYLRKRDQAALEVRNSTIHHLVISRDGGGSVLTKHYSHAELRDTFTSQFQGQGMAPTIVDVAKGFALSTTVSINAAPIIKEILTMEDIENAAPVDGGQAAQEGQSTVVAASGNQADDGAAPAVVPKTPAKRKAAKKAAKRAATPAGKVPAKKAAGKGSKSAPKTAKTSTKGKTTPKAASGPKVAKKVAKPKLAPMATEGGRQRKTKGDWITEKTRFGAAVREGDPGVRMHDGSIRTSVFRAVAKGGVRGITIPTLQSVLSTDYDIKGATFEAVRMELHKLMAYNPPRVEILK